MNPRVMFAANVPSNPLLVLFWRGSVAVDMGRGGLDDGSGPQLKELRAVFVVQVLVSGIDNMFRAGEYAAMAHMCISHMHG